MEAGLVVARHHDVDKLVGVTLQGGDERWIYIHIEVQGSRQAEFAERMFVYNYRLYDRYRRPVASMAVLADEHPNWRPDSFGFEVLGCKHNLMFPIAKLSDYRVDDLLLQDNAFAMITAAHILTQQTRKHANSIKSVLMLNYDWYEYFISDTGINNGSSIYLRSWTG